MQYLPIKYILTLAVALLACATLHAQDNKLTVESFKIDETDQAARIHYPRKDQNDKVCAIVKIETSLRLPDFTFDAGSVGITHTEQRTGEIWVWLSPGTQRLSILHQHLGALRNHPFGEALKDATVYTMKLKSGSVKTIVEDNVNLQYIEVVCAMEGATIKIDEANAEPFTSGKFQKLLSYGKHKYTVEAPMYHPESGITEITALKSTPINIALKPKFGKLTITTQPEQGAEVFIDDEKRGQSPVTIERLGSGRHTIRVIKAQFLPTVREITMTDGAVESLPLSMQPNFAVITLTTTGGGDIYINDEKKATARWSGRLSPGQYKVEVRKPSHRASITAIETKAGEEKTIPLEEPTPMYGSLDVKSENINANIFVDGKEQGTAPSIIKNVLVGSHSVELRAAGYKPFQQTVNITEGKMETVNAALQEEDKTATLKITSSPSYVSVSIDDNFAGTTPVTKNDLPLGRKTVSFTKSGYKPLKKTIDLAPGENEIEGVLKEKSVIHSVWLLDYRISPPTSYLGLSVGYCKRLGGYFQLRMDLNEIKTENLVNVDEHFSGGERKYYRRSITAGGMLRLFSFMYVYGGLGSGQYGAVYDAGGKIYSAGLISGLELEYGATFKVWKALSVTAGYSTIAGSDFGELHFGVGYIFQKQNKYK
jgi:hypothetical protein